MKKFMHICIIVATLALIANFLNWALSDMTKIGISKAIRSDLTLTRMNSIVLHHVDVKHKHLIAPAHADIGRKRSTALAHADIGRKRSTALAHADIGHKRLTALAHADIGRKRSTVLAHVDISRTNTAIFRLPNDYLSNFKMQILNGNALPAELLQHNFIDFCNNLANGTASETAIAWAEKWIYNYGNESAPFWSDTKRWCEKVRIRYLFNTFPLSSEEQNFPIAYGLLVHYNAHQVYYMLSAIYHPQNLYCLAISHDATTDFTNSILALQQCFPNVIVTLVPEVRWGSFSVLFGVYRCLQELSNSKHPWKYYQYLSGVDLPLRTNREMVEIFKQLNGSANVEIEQFQRGRLRNKINSTVPYNLTLFKSSLSATFSRKAANFLVSRAESRELLNFLNTTSFPDESFWASMFGNRDKFPIPGSFNGSEWLNLKRKYRTYTFENNTQDFSKPGYYISRYQYWYYGKNLTEYCHGRYKSSSCVFGVRDVYKLLRRPHLVVHKFYFTVQPAGYFCLYQKVRERAFADISTFKAHLYSDIPGSRLTRNESVENWFQENAPPYE